MRLPRKQKKKLKAIILCYTGNPEARKSQYSKKEWVNIKNTFIVWFRVFSRNEYKIANSVKTKNLI